MATTTSLRLTRPAPGTADALVGRIVESALACFAQYGVSKTTLEDIAQRAGYSRATLYRYFPGKQAVLGQVVESELRRVARDLDAHLSRAATLEDVLTGALGFVGREFSGHDALRHVFEVEPELVLPHLTFERAPRVFAIGSLLLAPHLGRFLPAPDVPRAGEWVSRMALTYLFCPSDAVSLTDEDSVRSLVRTFVLPALSPMEG